MYIPAVAHRPHCAAYTARGGAAGVRAHVGAHGVPGGRSSPAAPRHSQERPHVQNTASTASMGSMANMHLVVPKRLAQYHHHGSAAPRGLWRFASVKGRSPARGYTHMWILKNICARVVDAFPLFLVPGGNLGSNSNIRISLSMARVLYLEQDSWAHKSRLEAQHPHTCPLHNLLPPDSSLRSRFLLG